jgi:N-acyl-D-amino-acid deacylase
MRQLTAQAMQEGALGVASALIYAPGNYASTDELVALAEVAARHGGIYISHIRNEGNGELAALNEFLEIVRKARIPAEIYHLKVAGARNWGRMSDVIRRIEDARASGLLITADMYPYTAGATGLDAAMPPWVQEGGLEEWRKRLQDPSIRRRVKAEMASVNGYDNLLAAAGSADRVLLTGFKTEKLKPLTSSLRTTLESKPFTF